MPKYMLIMRGTDETNAAMMAELDEMMVSDPPVHRGVGEGRGVYVEAEGLDDPGQGVVVDFGGEAPVVTDGPYGETKELFGGYFLLDVAVETGGGRVGEAGSGGPRVQDRDPAGARGGRGPAGQRGIDKERAGRVSNGHI